MSDEPTFEGFVPPTKNYFPMPNEWIDICSQIKSLAEIKVIFYILRHTWGYHEYGITKVISFDEFMVGRKRNDGTRMDSGTGLSRQSVIDGLSLAVKHGYIICEVDATDLARVKKSYALKMRSGVKNLDPQISSLNSIPQGSNIYTSEVKEVDSRGLNSTPRSEKYTKEIHLGNTPKEKQVFDASASTSAPVTDLHQWRTDSEKRRAMFADVPLSRDIEEDISLLETRKHEATDPQKIIAQTPAPGVPAIPPHGSDASAQALSVSPSRDAAQRSTDGTVQASILKRPRGKVTQANDEPVPMPKCDTREIQRRINEHRGYALEEKVEIVRERQAIKTWCNLHTLEEYGLVMSGAKNDKYWGKAENYYRIGGLTLLKITPEILARQRQPLPMAANGNGHQSDMEGLVSQNGLVLWQGQWMTEDEANETGFNGGFGLYK